MRREAAQARIQAAAVTRLATQHQFFLLFSHVRIYEGSALIDQGQPELGLASIRQGIEELHRDSRFMAQSRFATMLAKGHIALGQSQPGLDIINAALAAVEQSGEHWFDAELRRRKGELLQIQGASSDIIERHFDEAIAISYQQQSRIFELRATVSLCRLLQEHSRSAEAHARLSTIYNWFTEGFDTPDLVEAKTLLTSLEESL
jgi:predicted ATPase